MSYYIGIDIGGTKIAYGLFDENKKLVSKIKMPTNTDLYAEDFFDMVCSTIHLLLNKQHIRFEDVKGIGIGMPSFMCFDKGYVIKTPSIPSINGFYVRDYMQSKLGDKVRIVIDNDGNTGALAEFRYGAGRGFEHMVFCLVSTGIGSSIIINKALFRGTYGWAGESGHTLIAADTTDIQCGCNNMGCVNSLCSGKMIIDHVNRWIEGGEKSLLAEIAGGVEKISAEHIDRAFELGDSVAMKAVEQMAHYMAIWLYNIYVTLNINCFVFSGGLLAMGDKLFGRVKERFDEYNNSDYPVYFLKTQLGIDTGIVGAMELLFT